MGPRMQCRISGEWPAAPPSDPPEAVRQRLFSNIRCWLKNGIT